MRPYTGDVCERELESEIVESGVWLYDDAIPTDVWIVRQNFEYWYEPGYEDGPEELNSDGETYQVLFVREGRCTLGPSALSLESARAATEELLHNKVQWTNHIRQRLFGGRFYSLKPVE